MSNLSSFKKPTIGTQNKRPTTDSRLTDTEKKLSFLEKYQALTGSVFLALIVASVFALGAIWNDYLAMKQATYLDLRDKVEKQNLLLEELIQKQN